MQFIYSRVSTDDQNVEQQTAILLNVWPTAEVIQEHASGKDTDREGFQSLIERMREGDSVLVYDISRISRKVIDVLQFVETCKERGISIHVHTLGSVDVTSATGQMVVTTLASVAQMQREEMLEKQKIGIARAKTEGKYKGKQQSPETIANCEKALGYHKDNGLNKVDAAKLAGVSKATFYRWLKENQAS
ncbi:MAG: recombinase family protein [Shewanella sp.]